MLSISERLKQLRLARNLTQKQLALSIDASERGIQNYELGVRAPTVEILVSLADYFDVSLDYLVGRSQDPTRHP